MRRRGRTQAQPYRVASSARNGKNIVSRRLRACLFGVDGSFVAADNVLVECVFYIRREIWLAPQAADVGFILREEDFRLAITAECIVDHGRMA